MITDGRGQTDPALSAGNERTAWTVYSLWGDDPEGDTDVQMDYGVFAVFLNSPVEAYDIIDRQKTQAIFEYSPSL